MMHDFITFYFTGLYCSTNVLHNLLSIHVIIFDDHCYIMILLLFFFYRNVHCNSASGCRLEYSIKYHYYYLLLSLLLLLLLYYYLLRPKSQFNCYNFVIAANKFKV